MVVGLLEGPSYHRHSLHTDHFFTVLSSERPHAASLKSVDFFSSPASLWPSFHSSPELLTPLGFLNGMLEVSESGALNHYTSISSHPVDVVCIQKSNFNSFSSFRIPGFSAQRSDPTHSRSGILSPDGKHASGGVVFIFIRKDLSFSEFSTSSLSLRLTPTLIM